MSDSPSTQPQGAVTVLVTRRVKRGHAQAFETAMRQMVAPARALGLASHTEGEQQVRQLNGSGYWFAEPKGPVQFPPPRWTVVVMTWVIAPSLTAWFKPWLHPATPPAHQGTPA